MKKNVLSFFLSIFMVGIVLAKPVDSSTALTVATHFYQSITKGQQLPNGVRLELVYEGKIHAPNSSLSEFTSHYIYNVIGMEGYVIVAGDDRAYPVWGYSNQSSYNPNDVPINMEKWMDNYQDELIYILKNDIRATDEITRKWNELIKGDTPRISMRTSVSPLVATRWDQGGYYKSMCPGGSVTGCVATAMAQVMKFWNHPAQGTGYHSYNEDDYGTLSANFGNTTYNWSAMPNIVSSNNPAVATLMYHCGVSVNMNYSPNVSGAYVANAASPITNCSEYAFKNYFRYSPNLKGVLRQNYSESGWVNLMKSELSAGRPLLHAGVGNGGGHAFVCDGFDSNSYFHFNWGWGGQADGYFWNSALNPGSLGTGAGSGGYNSHQHIIIGMQPDNNGGGGGGTPPAEAGIVMNSDMTISPNPIGYGQAVGVNVDILNNSNASFSGDIAVALFDNNSAYVDVVEIKPINNLPAGNHYQNGINFVKSAGLSASPGTYKMAVLVRPTGGNWTVVGSTSQYQNPKDVNIVQPNDIKMYANIQVSPNPIMRNQAFATALNIGNYNNSTAFTGSVSIDIHKLDGSHIGVIDEKANLSLSPLSYFSNGLTFNSNGLDLDPGTYKLAVWAKQDGGQWKLVQANEGHTNPIDIVIRAPGIQADAYEENNTKATAFTLTPSFSGNNANIKTTGSNIHTGGDIDFYKINLEGGYKYTIDARLHDSYSTTDGNTYTVDALWSYNADGNWSNAYDDVLSTGNIIMEGGNTIYFQTASYFTGHKGTYILDINLSRVVTSSTDEMITQNSILIQPNPATDKVQIMNKGNWDIQQIEVFNTQGAVVQSLQVKNANKNPILSTHELPNGIYFIHITTPKGSVNKKLIVHH